MSCQSCMHNFNLNALRVYHLASSAPLRPNFKGHCFRNGVLASLVRFLLEKHPKRVLSAATAQTFGGTLRRRHVDLRWDDGLARKIRSVEMGLDFQHLDERQEQDQPRSTPQPRRLPTPVFHGPLRRRTRRTSYQRFVEVQFR